MSNPENPQPPTEESSSQPTAEVSNPQPTTEESKAQEIHSTPPPSVATIPVIVTNMFHTNYWDTDLPTHRPVNQILEKLIDGLKMPRTDERGAPIDYRLVWQEGGRNLDPTQTLIYAGVQAGHTLTIAQEARAGC